LTQKGAGLLHHDLVLGTACPRSCHATQLQQADFCFIMLLTPSQITTPDRRSSQKRRRSERRPRPRRRPGRDFRPAQHSDILTGLKWRTACVAFS
jgi:hypothetical protein